MKKFLVVLAACGGGGGQTPQADAPDNCPAARTVFLNREGGTYTPGNDDSSNNVTVIVQTETTLPAPNVVEADWTIFVACMTTRFAPFNVVVTDQDPGALAHTEVVVIDTPPQIGLGNGVGGVAPFGCEAGGPRFFDRGVTFVMWEGLLNGDRCQVGAQGVGNSFGLDHEMSCPDIMSFLTGCGAPEDKTFTDAVVECGEDTPRACTCGGGTTQNSFRYLTETLGAACD